MDDNTIIELLKSSEKPYIFFTSLTKLQRNNAEIVKTAMSINPNCYIHIGTKFKMDKNYIEIALKYKGSLFKYIPKSIRHDFQYINHLLAIDDIKLNENCYEYLPNSVYKDKDLLIKFLRKKLRFNHYHVERSFFGDKIFVEECIKCQVAYFKFASDELQEDIEYIIYLAKNVNHLILFFINFQLFKEYEICKLIVDNNLIDHFGDYYLKIIKNTLGMNQNNAFENINTNEECCICYENIENEMIITKCKHIYCNNCINKHLNLNNQFCPMCRQSII